MSTLRFSPLLPVSLMVAGLAVACSEQEGPAVKHWVYFGTGASHIYVSAFDPESGELGVAREVAEIGRPGFLAVHPSADILYAVGRDTKAGSPPEGFVAAFQIDTATGDLRELNRAPTAGRGASHVAVNAGATVLVAVNYGDGNTVSLALQPDGTIAGLVSDLPHSGSSVHPERQTAPHPHSANFTPDGSFVVVPDLGTDELVSYSVDSGTAHLARRPDPQVKMAPGSGPRHMTFHSNGRWAYVINELASTVTVMEYGAGEGALEPVQTISTLPEGYDGPGQFDRRGAGSPQRAVPVRIESREQYDCGIRDRAVDRAPVVCRAGTNRWRLAPQFQTLSRRRVLASRKPAIR